MLLCMLKISGCTLLAAVCLGSLSLGSAIGEDHFPSNEDMRHVRSMAQPKVSPDGQQVLVQIADATADGGKTHLWLVDVKTNTSRQLTWSPTGDKRGESQGQWMPDGSSILFMAHRGEHTQLFRLPMNGGEAHAFEVKIVPPVDRVERAGRDSACEETGSGRGCSEARTGGGGRLALLHRAGWEAHRDPRARSGNAGRKEAARRQGGCGVGQS